VGRHDTAVEGKIDRHVGRPQDRRHEQWHSDRDITQLQAEHTDVAVSNSAPDEAAETDIALFERPFQDRAGEEERQHQHSTEVFSHVAQKKYQQRKCQHRLRGNR
jgi:hypothetical protein